MNKAKIFGFLSAIALTTGTLLAQSGVFTKDDTSSTPWQVIMSGASKLLAKIEELTLHQMEQEKRLDAQQAEIGFLTGENAKLCSLLNAQ